MNSPGAALIIALLLIAAILFLFRWELQTTTGIGIYRLDRWTGSVYQCKPSGGKLACE